jgi:hypothetical protein
MKIVKAAVYALEQGVWEPGWHEIPFPDVLPKRVEDLKPYTSYELDIAIQLEPSLVVTAHLSLIAKYGNRPFERESNQEEYEHFLKVYNFCSCLKIPLDKS